MGAKVHERLRQGDVRVVSVDDLALESVMTSVWAEAQMSATRYDGLFADVLDCIERRVWKHWRRSLTSHPKNRRLPFGSG
jgi:hypothetical protein